MKKIYYEAGSKIRFLREEKHYTREHLAELADISPNFCMKSRMDKKDFRPILCIGLLKR